MTLLSCHRRDNPGASSKRITALKTLAKDMSKDWQEATVPWYGGQEKAIRYLTGL